MYGSGSIRILHADNVNGGGWCGFAVAGNNSSMLNLDVDKVRANWGCMVSVVGRIKLFQDARKYHLKWAVCKEMSSHCAPEEPKQFPQFPPSTLAPMSCTGSHTCPGCPCLRGVQEHEQFPCGHHPRLDGNGLRSSLSRASISVRCSRSKWTTSNGRLIGSEKGGVEEGQAGKTTGPQAMVRRVDS